MRLTTCGDHKGVRDLLTTTDSPLRIPSLINLLVELQNKREPYSVPFNSFFSLYNSSTKTGSMWDSAMTYPFPKLVSNRAWTSYEGLTSEGIISSSFAEAMIHFVLLISRQGKVRLTKWYSPYSQKERTKVIRELSGMILTRGPKLCNFVEWRGYKVVYKRYASLYFCMCIDQDDNELEILEIIHHFVEILDRYFGSVRPSII
ncbi:AP-1 complex subunit sigma-2 [Striga asiatica]|uniref:AP-1 complex subunit sigma-2 n=1 Tax=Striga asiatica TaxID=4170 RepID=A0A5A7PN80_STRAF|nr:AP-1 complex subunit sigma-2 [Striga asiatica]